MKRKITFDWNKGLTTACIGLGGLCIFYFLILVIFVGLSTKFNFVWLLAGVCLLVLGILFAKNKIKLSKGAGKAASIVVAAGLIIFLNIEGLIVSGFFEKGEEKLEIDHFSTSPSSSGICARLSLIAQMARPKPPLIRI